MTKQIQKDFSRQSSRVTCLADAGERYTVTKFETEEFLDGTIVVKRLRKPISCTKMAYDECFIIGRRGGIRQIYSIFAGSK